MCPGRQHSAKSLASRPCDLSSSCNPCRRAGPAQRGSACDAHALLELAAQRPALTKTKLGCPVACAACGGGCAAAVAHGEGADSASKHNNAAATAGALSRGAISAPLPMRRLLVMQAKEQAEHVLPPASPSHPTAMCAHIRLYPALVGRLVGGRTHFHCGSMRRACETRSLDLSVSPLSGPQRLACMLICCFNCNNLFAQQFHV